MRIIIKTIFWIWAKITYRVKINGKENIPKNGAVLICPNHIHPLDSALIIAGNKRKINVLAKEKLFSGKIGKWFAGIFGIYPIKQNSADIDAIKTSLKILKNNEPLMIFPEGTRNGMRDGKPVKNGPVMIAIKSNTPILPVGISDPIKAFHKTTINIGKPIFYNEYKDKTKNKECITNLTTKLMDEVIRLKNIK